MNTSEDSLQAKIHIYTWNNYPALRGCFWHIANERKVTPVEGARLKAKGVVAGVPDYVLNYAGKTYYFELKTAKGTLSYSQKKVHAAKKQQGLEVFILRSFEEYLETIKNIVK